MTHFHDKMTKKIGAPHYNYLQTKYDTVWIIYMNNETK